MVMTDSGNSQGGAETGRSGFMSFWGSLPGVLTGLAGLVSAFGIYMVSGGSDPGPTPPPPPTTQISAISEPQVPVVVPVLIDPSELQAAEQLTSQEPVVMDPLEACAQGDPVACEQLLEELASLCLQGDPDGCNVLYEVSPVDSELEDLGATCGYVLEDWSYAGECHLL